MKKCFKIILTLVVLLFLIQTQAKATAIIGGTILKTNYAKRMFILKLKSGNEKTVVIASGAKAYKMNKPTLLSSFRPGEYVVIKISNPISETPWKAEIIMDSYSSQQYHAYRKISPTYARVQGGGFMTSAGPAPLNIPQLTGVYPNAIRATSQWPNNTQLPPSISWGKKSGAMKAAPSPWGSPAIGAAISGPGGDSKSSNWGKTGGNTSINYDTGPAAETVNNNKDSIKANPSGSSGEPGLFPNQAGWTMKPKQNTPTKKLLNLQGRVRQYDAEYNAIHVKDLNSSNLYTVMIRKNTKIIDFLTGEKVSADMIRPGNVVNISGILSTGNMVNAFNIKVQR